MTSGPRTDWEQGYAAVERDYADYGSAVRASADARGRIPHCDMWVLHAPDDNCRYCNDRPELQSFRLQQRIGFTGHPVPNGWRPCPAEVMRPTETINRWHGNVAMTPEVEAAMERYYADLRKQLGLDDGG